jgi:O-antigen/teichoic acid export membrane protein
MADGGRRSTGDGGTAVTERQAPDHYSREKVARSLVHFLGGKALTAVSTVLVLLLLARFLSKEAFGAFVTFQAVVSIVGLVASFGTNQVLVRFVPELRTRNNNRTLYRFAARLFLRRVALFGAVLAATSVAGAWLADFLGFPQWIAPFRLYLLAGWFALSWFLLAQVMEALLWQKSSQYLVAATGLVRLVILVVLALQDALTLQAVVLTEIFCEMLTLAALVTAAARNYLRDPLRLAGEIGWLDANRARLRHYAFTGYLQALTSLFYGSSPNRAAAARFLPPAALGEFGFADSVAVTFRRLLPANLLAGFLRTLFVARYTQSSDSRSLESMADLAFRLNLLLVSVFALLVLLVGGPVLDGLTDGKYGGTALLVAGMLGLLAVEGLMVQLALICQTLEFNLVLAASNIVLSLSLVAALPLFPEFGPWAIVVANTVGNIGAILLIRGHLAGRGHVFRLDARLAGRIVLALLLGVAAGQGAAVLHGGPWAMGAIGVAIYLLVLWRLPPFSAAEISLFASRFPRWRIDHV